MELGVYCLGMHRSGTSAATRLISLLGLRTPPAYDLVQPTEKNPKGYWESELLVWFNERVLEAVGSDIRWPVILQPGWEHDVRLAQLREKAPAVVSQVFPASPWVWKDPRHCLTLAFWRSVLNVAPVAVLVNRNPLEIAGSAQRLRTEQGKMYSLALWERYLRQGVAQLAGLPVLVTRYEDLISDPVTWSARTRAFLAANGVPARAPDRDEVLTFVDHELKHVTVTRAELLSDLEMSGSQQALFLALEELDGAHERFAPPVLPSESPTTESRIAEHRRVVRAAARDAIGARPSDWRSRVGRSRYGAPARPLYAYGRRMVEVLRSAVGSRARRPHDR